MIFVWRFTILCFQRISIFILEKQNNKNKRVNTVPLSLNEGINDCLKWLLTTYKILLCYHSTYLHQVKLWSSQLWTQFCNCVEYPEKVRTSMGLSPWPRDTNPIEVLPFTGFFRDCLNCVHNSEDHAYLISNPQFSIWNISYITSYS